MNSVKFFQDDNFDISMLEEKIILPKKISEKSKHIVFIHGFAIDSRCWELFVNQNEKDYLHLINLPGHGSKTSYSPKNLSFKFMVNLVKKYLKELSLNYHIILIGHSYGAAISLVAAHELVKENNSKIDKVILLAPYSKYSITKIIDKINLFKVKDSKSFMKLQEIIFVNSEQIVSGLKSYLYEKLSLEFFRKNIGNFKWVILGMSLPSTFYKIDTALKCFGPNCYFLFGDKDKLVNYKKTIMRASSNVFQKPYISIYSNCGHGFFIEEKDKFYNEIQKIINS